MIHKAKATPESQCPVWVPTVPKQKSDILQTDTLKETLVENEKKKYNKQKLLEVNYYNLTETVI